MSAEDTIINELIKKFGFLQNGIVLQRARRITADIDMQNFDSVLKYAMEMLGFSILCTITGLDEGNSFGIIYHVGRQDGTVLNLKIHIPKDNPKISTITGVFPQADIYEREIADLLGIKIEGLAEGKRYPLPDDWPSDEYPLRKDWKAKKGETKDA